MSDVIEKEIEDLAWEHSQHQAPFWRLQSRCSECYKEHMKVKNRTVKTYNSTESREDYRNENYKIN